MPSDRNFKQLGANLLDLQTAWKDRLLDAQVLLQAGRHASAISMGLYALEKLLKTLICARLDLEQLPTAFEVHDLDGLLVLTGLNRRLNHQPRSPVKQNWDSLREISKQINDLRYKPDDGWNVGQATEVLTQLEDETSGVIQWLLSPP